jgi:RecA-family ATPase
MLHESDPFTCVDLDVKSNSTAEDLQRFHAIIDSLDSYSERSRSGAGWHVWVKANVGKGRRRDGVEIYSQERFIICTGDVVRQREIMCRQDIITNMAKQMFSEQPQRFDLWGDDNADWSAAALAAEDQGELGRLFRGDWVGRYPSQSEADLALVRLLVPLTGSPLECWRTFRLSKLGARDKAARADYAQSTIAQAVAQFERDAVMLAHGKSMADNLLGYASSQSSSSGANMFDIHIIDWTNANDVDVPDIVDGLVADEEVTLLGGHGGVGKGFLALQIACAVALGEPVLSRSTRQSRVLYYSAEDGRKRITRRIRRMVQTFDYSSDQLQQNLRLIDASELEPLYGPRQTNSGDSKKFLQTLGSTSDFENLRQMVAAFDPQLVIVDGASDTFDGNEIARREVRAFIKMLRQLHPQRPIGVLLIVHIDRSSARGYTTNDDGYAGSAQWHNSSRRRMFLQHQVKRDDEDRDTILSETFMLRVMKNQDGPPAPDMELQRGEWGLWQFAVEIDSELASKAKVNHGPTIARLIARYYEQGHFMSVSLAPQATTGVYATLKSDPGFPRGLNRKRTAEIVRELKRNGVLVEEPYVRPNRTHAERWSVVRDPDDPFERAAPSAQTGTG